MYLKALDSILSISHRKATQDTVILIIYLFGSWEEILHFRLVSKSCVAGLYRRILSGLSS